MLSTKALELIKDLDRCPDALPPFNDDTIRQVLNDIKIVFNENHRDALACSTTGNRRLLRIINLRHGMFERSKRCLLAYLYKRLEEIKEIRWEIGSTIPAKVKPALCEPEIQWFNNYNRMLSNYMSSIGEGQGIDLTCDLEPPKSLFTEVRCLKDYGKFELEDGEVVLLKKNSQHYLPRLQIEPLIKQGILMRTDRTN